MTVNTFVLSGVVTRLEQNNKPTRKGPAAVIVVQYGPNRNRTDQPVQFMNVALIRVPPYVYDKCKDNLREGAWVDITGHVQGVLKPLVSEGYITNELVADRLQFANLDEDEPEQSPELAAA